jgi:hypothetical protein
LRKRRRRGKPRAAVSDWQGTSRRYEGESRRGDRDDFGSVVEILVAVLFDAIAGQGYVVEDVA